MLFDYPVRDTSVCLGPAGDYYLTGTTGYPGWWKTNDGIRVWKSNDLTNWTPLGLVWSFAKNATWQKEVKDGQRAIWAPEIIYLKDTFWIAYCVNWPGGGTGLLKSTSGKAEGPYADVKPDGPLTSQIDPSLFQDDDGKVYFVWQNGLIARMKDDMSGLAEQPRLLQPANAKDVGFEGAFLTKIGGRYQLVCAEFNSDSGTSTYDCMAASSANIYGPYGDRYLAIAHAGHNTLFKNKEGRWWATFFGNDSLAPWREHPGVLPIHLDTQGRITPGPDARPSVREISAVRYAPPGMYMKDHCLIQQDGQWHLFAPLGEVGTMWHHEGSEESAEQMVSDDLVHWKRLGTAVPASKREGYFDGLMGGIAPHVIAHDGGYFMYYAGWDFRGKQPLDMHGFRQGIGLALSKDLIHWEKPAEFAKDGLAPKGSDPCVTRDDSQQRWLMYVGSSGADFVYESKDLTHWSEAGCALGGAELAGGTTDMNPGESPFVMKHPRSGRWIIFVNGGYAVSDDPLKFPRLHPYPFKAGIFLFPGAHDEGKGTF